MKKLLIQCIKYLIVLYFFLTQSIGYTDQNILYVIQGKAPSGGGKAILVYPIGSLIINYHHGNDNLLSAVFSPYIPTYHPHSSTVVILNQYGVAESLLEAIFIFPYDNQLYQGTPSYFQPAIISGPPWINVFVATHLTTGSK